MNDAPHKEVRRRRHFAFYRQQIDGFFNELFNKNRFHSPLINFRNEHFCRKQRE